MTKEDEPVVETTYLKALSQNGADLLDRLLETVGEALSREGAQGFSILRSTADDSEFLVVERWTNDAAALEHVDTPVLHSAHDVARTVGERLRWRRII